MDFADPEIRRRWVEEKGLKVLSFFDPANVTQSVDLIAIERAADRPIDRQDVKALEVIRNHG